MPSPTKRSAVKIVACASSPATMVRGGAPISPSRTTSQPARSSTVLRAAARQVAFAIWAPVTSPTLAVAGRPSTSSSQPSTTSSTTAAAGEATYENPFWSHAAAIQSAARAAGSAPPVTKPK